MTKKKTGGWEMMGFSMGSLLMAVMTGMVAFGGAAGSEQVTAMIVFYVFMALFVVSLLGMAAGAAREARRANWREELGAE